MQWHVAFKIDYWMHTPLASEKRKGHLAQSKNGGKKERPSG